MLIKWVYKDDLVYQLIVIENGQDIQSTMKQVIDGKIDRIELN